jgi:magnesium chelatase family protein
MLSKIYSAATIGLDGVLIEVEVDVAGRGFPTFTIVGLPNKAVDEAKDRVRTAITNASFEMPDSRITVNLAPADIPKSGSSFDLPIAVGILASSGLIKTETLGSSMFVGELSLEGRVRKIPGMISVALLAKEKHIEHLFVPVENAAEVTLIKDVHVYPVATLMDLINHLNTTELIKEVEGIAYESIRKSISYEFNFADIKGQEQAKRALEIAAAGMHNVHLRGVPGAGKTLLSRSFPSILPPLNESEVLEVSKMYSVCGLLNDATFIVARPFRSPHHTTSRIGLIGGGSNPAPGEISLAHRGVLFLDELPEFPRGVLEAMRQPLEDGFVTISRAAGSLTFPSRFLLLAASNPCPCGYLGHPKKKCTCLPGHVMRYKKRLSGPLLDRIDLHIDVPPVEDDKLLNASRAEPSEQVRERVMKARLKQQQRFQGTNIFTNSEMRSADVKKFCDFTSDAKLFLQQAITKLSLSARSYFKVIKVAQTIADLDGKDAIEHVHIAEALQYRVKEE